MYRTYRIPKRNGKYRVIREPNPELKAMQWAIAEKLNTIPLMDCVHGFVLGRDIVSNAKCHQQKRYVLNVDIKDFFPSIASAPMRYILGYHIKDEESIAWIATICFWNDCLPQGAPTSPVLANLYMEDLDILFSTLAERNGWSYSRYADDITFSGDDSLKEKTEALIGAIDKWLGQYHLIRNQKKTKLMPYYQRQVVTGVVVNNERLTLSRKTKEEWFQRLKGRLFNSLDEHEIGYLEYVRHIDEKFHGKLLGLLHTEVGV